MRPCCGRSPLPSSGSSAAAEPTSRRQRMPVQEALIEAGYACWPNDPPRDPKGWLVTAAWRKFHRHRPRRHLTTGYARAAPKANPRRTGRGARTTPCSCTSSAPTRPCRRLRPSRLTLRAVGGLTTRQIAQAYLVPEATMAQRISRAKRTVSGVRLNQPATSPRCCACSTWSSTRATRATSTSPPRPSGSRASWRHSRGRGGRRGCWRSCCSITHGVRRGEPLTAGLCRWPNRSRTRWDARLIAEGVAVLQAALARDHLGEHQAQAAIAALARRRPDRRGDRLGAGRGVVRRSGAAHRQPGRPPRPVGTRWARPPVRQGPDWPPWRASTPPCPAIPPSPPTSTAWTATRSPQPGSTPRPPSQRPTSPNERTRTRQASTPRTRHLRA